MFPLSCETVEFHIAFQYSLPLCGPGWPQTHDPKGLLPLGASIGRPLPLHHGRCYGLLISMNKEMGPHGELNLTHFILRVLTFKYCGTEVYCLQAQIVAFYDRSPNRRW